MDKTNIDTLNNCSDKSGECKIKKRISRIIRTNETFSERFY